MRGADLRPADWLDGLRLASPCAESWDSMVGDDRARRCGRCALDVFDLSTLTRAEAESLVRGATGRICLRYFRRQDGTVLTRDCPVGLASWRRRAVRWFAAAAGACAAVLTGLISLGTRGPRVARTPGPISVSPTSGSPRTPVLDLPAGDAAGSAPADDGLARSVRDTIRDLEDVVRNGGERADRARAAMERLRKLLEVGGDLDVEAARMRGLAANGAATMGVYLPPEMLAGDGQTRPQPR